MAILNWLMNAQTIAALAPIIATVVALLGFFPTLRGIRQRQKSDALENDLRATKLFTEIVGIAHGRGDGYFSEAVATALMNQLTENKLPEDQNIADFIWRRCSFNLSIGEESQKAALDLIAELGIRYEILRIPCELSLERFVTAPGMERIGPTAEKALHRLRFSKCDGLRKFLCPRCRGKDS